MAFPVHAAFRDAAGEGTTFFRCGAGSGLVGIGGPVSATERTSEGDFAWVGLAGPFHFRQDIGRFRRAVALAKHFDAQPLEWLPWLMTEAIEDKVNEVAFSGAEVTDEIVDLLCQEFEAVAPARCYAAILQQVFDCASASLNEFGRAPNEVVLVGPGQGRKPGVRHEAVVRAIVSSRTVDDVGNQQYLCWVASRARWGVGAAGAPLVVAAVELNGLTPRVRFLPQGRPAVAAPPRDVHLEQLAAGASSDTVRGQTPTETLVALAAKHRKIVLQRVFAADGRALVPATEVVDVFRAGARAFLAGKGGILWAMRDVLASRGIVETVPPPATELTAKTAVGEFGAVLFNVVAPNGGGDRSGAIVQLQSSAKVSAPATPCLPSPWWAKDTMAPGRAKEFACVYSNPADRMLPTTCACKPGDTPATVAERSAQACYGARPTPREVATVLPPCMIAALKDPSGYWKRWRLALNVRDLFLALADRT